MVAPATTKLLAFVWLLTAFRQVTSALNVTQAILDNIQGPSSLGTRASNFTTTSNYTAITQILATHTDFSHDEIALGDTVFAVADFVGTPSGSQVGPLLTRAIARAAVPISVQIAAYGHAIAKASFVVAKLLNDTTATPEQRASIAQQVAEGRISGFSSNTDMSIILTGIQPQIDQGLFTFKDVMAKALVTDPSPVSIASGLFVPGSKPEDLSLFSNTTFFGAANIIFGATAENFKHATGSVNPAAVIAEALQATAALASVAQNGTHDGSARNDIQDNTHDLAVIQSIVQATHDANISSAVLASALADAINLALTQGGQLPASYDPEVAAIIIAAAHALQQDKAITTGFSQARQAGFDFQKDDFQIICRVLNNTMIVDNSAGQIALQASGAMC